MYQRRKAREISLQVLYEIDVLKIDPREAMDLFWESFTAPEEALEPFWDYFCRQKDAKKQVARIFGAPPDARSFSTLLVEGTWRHRREIDKLISGCSEHWSLSRMSKVDRSILRMAVYELLYCDDIPPKVTLNEAIDLGKAYGSENSGSFINGILDALYVKLRGKQIESQGDEREDG